jgi:ureidoglycolate hydrolase
MIREISLTKLVAQPITKDNFQPYGQLIFPTNHDKIFDENDAQLKLNKGTPRFYIMRLENRGKKFSRITKHNQCTQCLGSLNGKNWFIAVAAASAFSQPKLGEIHCFYIPGNCFIKLEIGTWHAGPYFDHDYADFYNLELSNTNIIDHVSYDFLVKENTEFEITL